MLKKITSIVVISFILFLNMVNHQGVSANVTTIGKIYYVDTQGDNSNNGLSIDAPFQTIQMAANVMVAGDTCYIRGGTYREAVTPVYSGTINNPITYRNYNNENVTVSGTQAITGWSVYSGSIYKATMPLNLSDENQLFVGETMVNEACWPNTTSDIMHPTLAVAQSGTATTITDGNLNMADNFFAGAKVWCVGGLGWLAQSSTITASSQADNRITFEPFSITNNASYDPAVGNSYKIFGSLALLDTENEWYYDNNTQTVYLYAPSGVNPNTISVEAKVRRNAFDISNKAYIQIDGINTFSSTVIMNSLTNNCKLDNLNMEYVYHSNVNNGPNAQASKGVILNGSYNTITNSTIEYSSASLITVGGSNNSIINCSIAYANYTGNGMGAIGGWGTQQLISNNTIHDSGRFIIAAGFAKSQIQYNDLYNANWITKDAGIFYVANTDGQNTRIHHNKVHDNKAAELGSGIYLDNYTCNFIIDHNVTSSIRLNNPSSYNLVYNNTCIGEKSIEHGGTVYGNDMYADRLFNNIFTGSVETSGGAVLGKNIYADVNPQFVNLSTNDYRLQLNSPAKDIGEILTGITDGYIGDYPDCGAFEYGGVNWTAGCDFSNPPSLIISSSNAPYMNLIKNGGFEENTLNNWTKTGTQTATVASGNAWFAANSISKQGSYAAKLGSGTNGLEQTISDLKANTKYTFSAWIKCDEGEVVEAGVYNFGGSPVSKDVGGNLYKQVSMNFATGIGNTSATIYLSKTSTGSGNAYVDLIGVTLKDVSSEDDSFENGLDNWISDYGTPVTSNEQAYSGDYSYIVNEDQSIINKELGASYNKIVSIYFYDNGHTNSVCMARVDKGTPDNPRGLGINTVIDATRYTYMSDNVYNATIVPRSIGWHNLKWDYTSGTKVDMYIDNILVLSQSGVVSFNNISIGDSILDGTISGMYFDDVTIYDYDGDDGTFENGYGGWSTMQNPSTSTSQKHSGLRSYSIDEDVDILSKNFEEDMNKIVTIWFYDTSYNTSMTCLARVDDGSEWRALGVDTQISTTKYVYSFGNASIVTGINRSSGWHELKWDYRSAQKVYMYIDGLLVISDSGVTSFNSIAFGDWHNDGVISRAYFDDVALKDIDIPTFYDSFESGFAEWSEPLTKSAEQKHSGNYSAKINMDSKVIIHNLKATVNEIVSIHFYDNGSTNAFCMARVDSGSSYTDTTTLRGLGIRTDVSVSKYLYRIGSNWVATDLPRSVGWHEFKWDYTSGTKVDMYIDNILVTTQTGVTSVKQICIGDWWSDGRISNMFFDDVRVYTSELSVGNPVIKVNGNVIEESNISNGLISCELSVQNFIDMPKPVTLMMVLYENNRLNQFAFTPQNHIDNIVYANQNKKLFVKLLMNKPFSDNNRYTIKTFVWSDLVNCVPL